MGGVSAARRGSSTKSMPATKSNRLVVIGLVMTGLVMAGLCPAIHAAPLPVRIDEKTQIPGIFLRHGSSFAAWMAGTSPAMTAVKHFRQLASCAPTHAARRRAAGRVCVRLSRRCRQGCWARADRPPGATPPPKARIGTCSRVWSLPRQVGSLPWSAVKQAGNRRRASPLRFPGSRT